MKPLPRKNQPAHSWGRFPGPRALLVGFLAFIAIGVGVQLWASAGDQGAGNESPGPQLPTGAVEALGVAVEFPVVDLGRVPLNTPAAGRWLLRNTGPTPIAIGRPAIEVLDGC